MKYSLVTLCFWWHSWIKTLLLVPECCWCLWRWIPVSKQQESFPRFLQKCFPRPKTYYIITKEIWKIWFNNIKRPEIHYILYISQLNNSLISVILHCLRAEDKIMFQHRTRILPLSSKWVSSPLEHCAVLLGQTLNSHSASLHPGVWMGTGELSAGGNPAMD